MPQARFLPDHKATKPAKVVAPSIGKPNRPRGSHPIVWPMTRMAITIRKGPVNRQCVRPHLRELMMQANPIALKMKVPTTARGVGSRPQAPSMANPGKPHRIARGGHLLYTKTEKGG